MGLYKSKPLTQIQIEEFKKSALSVLKISERQNISDIDIAFLFYKNANRDPEKNLQFEAKFTYLKICHNRKKDEDINLQQEYELLIDSLLDPDPDNPDKSDVIKNFKIYPQRTLLSIIEIVYMLLVNYLYGEDLCEFDDKLLRILPLNKTIGGETIIYTLDDDFRNTPDYDKALKYLDILKNSIIF